RMTTFWPAQAASHRTYVCSTNGVRQTIYNGRGKHRWFVALRRTSQSKNVSNEVYCTPSGSHPERRLEVCLFFTVCWPFSTLKSQQSPAIFSDHWLTLR